MSASAPPTPLASPSMSLPSDQDATGRTLGHEELDLLAEAIASGTLTSTKGSQVAALEAAVAELVGTRFAIACSSGTAAVHTAIAAVNPEPGDEIVTTSITDMGALTPILYQGAIPVFADVDPTTGNVTLDSVAAVLSDRTRAIIATHLFGNPCDMAGLRRLATARGITLIEDAAQAWGTTMTHQGQVRHAGSVGDIGCFSLQQGKHATCGEGGVVVTDDPDLARRMRVFVNKAWPYGEANPDHEFLALNYRMSELQGAVARAQVGKLPGILARRGDAVNALLTKLDGLPGLSVTPVRAGDTPSWWRLCLLADEAVLPGGPLAVAGHLRDWAVASAPRYIVKPAFECAVFAQQRTFGTSRWPFPLARPEAVDYSPDRFPGTYAFLARCLVLPINEKYLPAHVAHVADALRAAADELATIRVAS